MALLSSGEAGSPANSPLDVEQKLVQIWSQAWGKTQQETQSSLKPTQIGIIKRLHNGDDTILIAPTGFGKSLIFQSVPLLVNGRIAIIIYPIDALERSQKTEIDELDNASAFILNGDSMNENNLKDIASGLYTHVLVSPEILLNRSFKQHIWYCEAFMRRLCLIAIDEMHFITQWGVSGFRPHYARLHQLRTFTTERKISWFGTTATLEAAAVQLCRAGAGFESEVILKEPIDRPEIFWEVKHVENEKDFTDLKFLATPPNTPNYPRILPKTIIYIDNIRIGQSIVDFLRKELQRVGWSREECRTIVKPFNSCIQEQQKNRLTDTFKLLDSRYRIFVATDAFGVGVNMPDVYYVIQWGLPKEQHTPTTTLVQRAGRAARGLGRTGHCIFMVDESYVGPQRVEGFDEDANLKDLTAAQKEQARRVKKRKAINRQVYKIVNEEECIREIILRQLNDKRSDDFVGSCCSRCTEPELRPIYEPGEPPTKKDPVPKAVKASMITALQVWRTERFAEKFKDSMTIRADPSEAFLTDRTIGIWASAGKALLDLDGAQYLTDWDPEWVEEEKECIFTAIRNMDVADANRKRMASISESRLNKPKKPKKQNQYTAHSAMGDGGREERPPITERGSVAPTTPRELLPAISINTAQGRGARHGKPSAKQKELQGTG